MSCFSAVVLFCIRASVMLPYQHLKDRDSKSKTCSESFKQDSNSESNKECEKADYDNNVIAQDSGKLRKRKARVRRRSARRGHETKKTSKLTDSSSSTRKKHRIEEVLSCNLCSKTFTGRNRTSQFLYHMKKHTGEKAFQCGICSKAFITAHHLRQHHTVVHEGQKLPKGKHRICTVCGKEIPLANFGRHVDTHSDSSVKPFKCDTCGKCYKYKRTLFVHLKHHAEEKPHECDVCGQGFTRKYLLTEHRAGHTGEKPFQCDLCHMRFQRSMYLKEHKRVQHCDEVFTENESGELQSTTGCFTCSICGDKFPYQCRLNAHIAWHKKQINQAYITTQQ